MEAEKVRIDKWLWAARFFKTRSIAVDNINKDRVQINGQNIKPAREVKIGDTVLIKMPREYKTVVVKGLSQVRGPAPVAQQLYEETAASIAERERRAEQHRFAPEPAQQLRGGRPTKRRRRDIERFTKMGGDW
ncbi:RNA-binding protein [Oligella sp. HMSC05A10]|uniref:RNA-binding S4 domain-containing protein n=1 Tax=Oligella sp. HMSC05A10 TaxID=1581112 RepID=UPI0008A3EF1D|nr:RNA-binding S4 domain-containing protein [Oligella sp. HMSC05A10]OFS84438.1 RNA-binding protein [Oligella sp. HMSC05A10]